MVKLNLVEGQLNLILPSKTTLNKMFIKEF